MRTPDSSIWIARGEEALRQSAKDAMNAGEYLYAKRFLELAEAVQAMRLLPAANGDSPPPKPKDHKISTPKPPTPAASKKRGQQGAYPRFARRGNQLVKIAWSKSTKAEYRHKAPWTAIEALTGVLQRSTSPGRIWRAEDILPIAGEDGEMPSYQAYLILSWLRSIGAVQKHGRDGYATDHAALAPDALQSHWTNLPEDRG